MWHLETQFNGGHGSVKFTVGLDDLKSLPHPDGSMVLWIPIPREQNRRGLQMQRANYLNKRMKRNCGLEALVLRFGVNS